MMKEYLEWDTKTWSKALLFWEKFGMQNNLSGKLGLELGGRNGGLSLFFSERLKTVITCSDYGGPSELARELHQEHKVAISYANISALEIDYPDNHFDFVVFKSILGSLADGKLSNQEKAIAEMYRVLKPGGVLFFAENLKASALHQTGRKYFVPWGQRWRYIGKSEIVNTLQAFDKIDMKYTGFLAAFVPNKFEGIKNIVATFDQILMSVIPDSWKYVGYGVAIK